ncbi:MAG: hypothetical protein ACT4PI_13000 [Actinomycetota bacterium]
MPSEDGPPWLPHQHPERPFDTWTWLDDCPACLLALQAEAAVRPRRVLCLKTHMDRILVTAEYLSEVLTAGGVSEDLCYDPDDWVREVFVPARGGRLPPSARWWSLTLWEEQQSAGIFDPPPLRGVVRRSDAP